MSKLKIDLLANEARNLYYSKDFTGAAKKYQEAANLTENLNRKVALFTSSGNCFRDAENYQYAVELFRGALNLVPESGKHNVTNTTILFVKTSLSRGLNQLGLFEYKQKKFDIAYKFFTEGADLTVNPKLKSACIVNAGQSAMRFGDFELAINNYDKAMQLRYINPALPKLKSQALVKLADKCVGEEKFDMAKAYLRNAIKLVENETLAKQYKEKLSGICDAIGEEIGDNISVVDPNIDVVSVVDEVEEAS